VELELNDLDELLESAKLGNRRSLSRLISRIESGEKFESPSSKSWTLGITGPPGAGKSTLIGQIARSWINNGEKVAVLAFDPSSPISGGSFLADRIRMEESGLRENLFVRSLSSGNIPGAIGPNVENMCMALTECGWSRIIIETVGSGQSEFRVVAFVDRILLVDGPDRGDLIQAEKAGVMELADVIAVNKSDLPGAEEAANNIRFSLGLVSGDNRNVHLVSAKSGSGIDLLMKDIDSCKPDTPRQKLRMRERLISEWDSLLLDHPEIESVLEKLCDSSITITEAIDAMRNTLQREVE